MKKYLLSIAILSCFCLSAQEPRKCSDDLKAILTKTFLNEKTEPFLSMVAHDAILVTSKEADAQDLIVKFKEAFTTDAVLTKLAVPYQDIFTDAEIKELRAVYDSPVFEKYTHQGNHVFQSNFLTIQETFKELANKHGTEKKVEKEAASRVIEVTAENYADVVEKAEKPLVLDIYSSQCGPCRNLEPVFNELANEHENVQFARLNCQTESDLADKHDVTQVPTILFIKPGEKAETMRTTGFTSKNDLNEKIVEFTK
jgi:thioredoxin 1